MDTSPPAPQLNDGQMETPPGSSEISGATEQDSARVANNNIQKEDGDAHEAGEKAAQANRELNNGTVNADVVATDVEGVGSVHANQGGNIPSTEQGEGISDTEREEPCTGRSDGSVTCASPDQSDDMVLADMDQSDTHWTEHNQGYAPCAKQPGLIGDAVPSNGTAVIKQNGASDDKREQATSDANFKVTPASNKQTKLDVVDGTQGEQLEYCIKGPGHYVIVDNDIIKYKYPGVKCSTLTSEDVYMGCTDRLKRTFGLDKSDVTIKHDIKSNLGPTGSKSEFDSFIENVLKPTKPEPEFLVFFLMSLGLKHGEFLLSSRREDSCVCGDQHDFSGNCLRRLISDLVRKIQEHKKFSGKPKIFVIQTHTGSAPVIETISKGPEKKMADKYIPRGSDTLVFYQYVEEKWKWVKKNSANLLIERLCQSVDELASSDKNAEDTMQQLYKILEPTGTEMTLKDVNEYPVKEEIGVKLNAHSLAERWLTDVCTKTSAHISNFLREESKKKMITTESKRRRQDEVELHGEEKVKRHEEHYYDSLQPYLSSTLRFQFNLLIDEKHKDKKHGKRCTLL